MSTYLDKIMATTLLRVTERKTNADLELMEMRAEVHKPRGFIAGLRTVAAHGPAVISELKKASPSKGVIRLDYHPAATAKTFQAVGAAALSVLTDEDYFQGSLADLRAVSDAVSIPVLRKDFMLDPFQILEARVAGADCILLIVAAHTDAVLKDLAAEAARWGLDVLCEVHDREELDRAVQLGFRMIGVNCRDLKTLVVKPETHLQLVSALPSDVLRVAESGIRDNADVERLIGSGYDAFLIGESLMRQPDPAAALALMLGKDYELVR
jgi:indole-3-glycerol phosphate synthase